MEVSTDKGGFAAVAADLVDQHVGGAIGLARPDDEVLISGVASGQHKLGGTLVGKMVTHLDELITMCSDRRQRSVPALTATDHAGLLGT
jgi:hypothetical protein